MPLATLPELWTNALDSVVAEALDEAGVAAPPVDAIALARALGAIVAVDGRLRERARHKSLRGRASAIFLKPDPRPERLQWAAAHELGEMHAWKVFGRATIPDEGEPSPRLREGVANLLAARFLLPGTWFPRDADALRGDVLELKAIYRTASHELIAMRLLDLPLPTVVTIFDQGRLTRRMANQPGRLPRPQPLERECRQEIRRRARPVELSDRRLRVQGWPIDEPGWRREILRTIPAGDWDDDAASDGEFEE
ncbi:MAG: ImmA/IrrE family metallo-endopeptidase [Planctomycetaceae bacterium]